jgi:hypothetical protein
VVRSSPAGPLPDVRRAADDYIPGCTSRGKTD